MRYFKMHLTKPEGSLIYETDFTVDLFDPFFRSLAATLMQRKMLEGDGKFEARIIPRTDGIPAFEKPRMVNVSDIADQGEGPLDIIFENAEPPVEKVKYLTLQIRSSKANFVYRFDWPLEDLTGGILRNVTHALLDEGTLQDREQFQVTISAHHKARPRVDPVVAEKEEDSSIQPVSVPVIIKSREALPPKPQENAVTVDVLDDDLDIVIGQSEELVKPLTKSMREYTDLEKVGEPNDQDLPVFVRRGAMKIARASGSRSVKTDQEVGGFLLGKVFHDSETGCLFIEISEVVEANQARGTFGSLEFNADSMSHLARILENIQKDHPDKFTMGWYHTHLVSLGFALPVEGKANEYTAHYMPFFSSHDLFIHRNFFPDPWHVGLVLDLRCHKEVFFFWQSGEIVGTRGFYLYGE
jgi:hypothetical protein